MRIAVTYESGQCYLHFGHTEQVKVYDVEDGKVVSSAVVPTNGSCHGALADLLAQMNVNALICGGIGGGARTALAEAGVILYGGCAGDADQAVEDLIAGRLTYDPNVVCSHHHDHGEGHDCGSHGCGHGGEGHDCRHGNCGGAQ